MKKNKQIDPAELRARALAALPQKGPIKKTEKPKLLGGKQAHEKGKAAEDKFLKAWEVRGVEPKPIFHRRATDQEDYNEKTDAVIEIADYGIFRIQIKSFHTSLQSISLKHFVQKILYSFFYFERTKKTTVFT